LIARSNSTKAPQTTTKFLARDDPSAAVEECEQNPHRLFA